MSIKLIMENWRSFKNMQESPSSDEFVQLAQDNPPLPQYVAILKKIAGDSEFRTLARSGRTDASGPPDEALSIERSSTPAQSLYATQAEIGFGNSLADQFINKFSATDAALGNSGSPIIMPSEDKPPPPILTYNGKWILDGHHRWSQVMMTNPAGIVAIDNISGPGIKSEEDALKVVQLAIASLAGRVVTRPFKGVNLMDASPESVYVAAKKNLTDEVVAKLADAKKIPSADRDLAAKYYAGNLDVIKQRKGKFSRETSMPQAGKSGITQNAVNTALKHGAINFINPSSKDSQAGSTRPLPRKKEQK